MSQSQRSYNAGKAVKPEPVVTAGGARLVKNKDYKVQYQNNKNAGTAFAIVTGKGAYRGKVVVPFTIKAAQGTSGMTVKSISAKTYNGKYQRPAPSVTIRLHTKITVTQAPRKCISPEKEITQA